MMLIESLFFCQCATAIYSNTQLCVAYILEIRFKYFSGGTIFQCLTQPSLVRSPPHPSGSQRQIRPCNDKL